MSDAFNVLGAGNDLAVMLRQATRNLLVAACTLAGETVETSRNDAFTDADDAAIAIYTPKISRTWLGDAPPQFAAKVSLAIVARVLASSLGEAESKIDALRVQIENALLGSTMFLAGAAGALPLERINSIETTIEFPGAVGTNEGQMTMVMECQCTDIFSAVVPPTPLATIGLTSISPLNPQDTMIGATITLSS